ncbi:MAG TPA: ComEC/Rec2 family competence protein [Candidatus Kapabacteria bacterium]|nr:ComEC/Rec2 family competence protein [Candidatus Kapabacteria bacterium]
MILHEENINNAIKVLHLPGVRLLLCASVFIPLAYYLNINQTTLLIIVTCGLSGGIAVARIFGFVPAFVILSAIIGIYIGTNARLHHIIIPEKKILPIKASFFGEIESIIKKDSNSLRLVCWGECDAEPLPPLSKIRIIASLKNHNNRLQSFTPGSIIRLHGLAKFPQKPSLPNDFDEETYCRGLDVQIIMSSSENNAYIVEKHDDWRKKIFIVSQQVIDRINATFSTETAGLMAALLIGDKSRLSLETKTNYSLAGASHVLAVSGLHIGIIAVMILIPLGFVRNKIIKLILFILTVTAFTIVTGLQPSALRASVMAILVMSAFTFQRKPQLLNIVCITAIFILLYDASLLFSVGFQLSFFAVLGIAIFYQAILNKILSIFPKISHVFLVKFIAESIAVSISATTLVSPFVAWYFDVFSLIGVFVNIIAVPLTSAAMIFGFIAIIISYISVSFADFYAVVASTLIQISDTFTQYVAVWKYSAIQGEESLIFSLISAFVLLYLIFSQNRRIFIFRLTSSTIMIVGIIILSANNQQKKMWQIIPRNDLVMTILPINTTMKFILLEDRKPHQNPRNDNALIDYLAKNNSSLIIGKRGNCAEWITVKVAEQRNVRIFPVPDSLYNHIQDIVGTTKLYSVVESKKGEL